MIALYFSDTISSFGDGVNRGVSDWRPPTNSVINPPDTNGFLTSGGRLTGGGTNVVESGDTGSFGTGMVRFKGMPEVGGGAVMGCGFACGGERTSGDGWRGGGTGRRDSDPVIKPGISSSSTSDDEGEDCRSISTVSDETGLT